MKYPAFCDMNGGPLGRPDVAISPDGISAAIDQAAQALLSCTLKPKRTADVLTYGIEVRGEKAEVEATLKPVELPDGITFFEIPGLSQRSFSIRIGDRKTDHRIFYLQRGWADAVARWIAEAEARSA